MKIAFIADPLDSFQIYKDTTFAMMREAAARGHALYSSGITAASRAAPVRSR